MMWKIENRCIVCPLYFCCPKCRLNHERSKHGLKYECPICRGQKYLCKPEKINEEFKQHLIEEHLPLKCNKCQKIFTNMDDIPVDKCVSVSELIEKNTQVNEEGDEAKFDSIYEKISNNNEGENFEAILSVNKASKTAIITPLVHQKHLVDYEDSDTDYDNSPIKPETPFGKSFSKTPKMKRAATPHVKTFKKLIRQNAFYTDFEEMSKENCNTNNSQDEAETTPAMNDNCTIPDTQKEMTTPTSHLTHVIKLAQAVTTSTPTHPANNCGWSIFPGPGADSPLSEIENSESPAQSVDHEPSKSESDMPRKLKSIIVTGSRSRLGSQDSADRVTSQDGTNLTEVSSVKIKRVKFAEDTVFEPESKLAKRVFRKPKRMLTPGPQKRYCLNPRFQALINRFENQGMIVARTPVNNRAKLTDHTPTLDEHLNMPARAINFKEDSPIVDIQNYSKESNNELFKSCIETPESTGLNNAITVFTANVAGSLQNCLSTVLKTTEEETEIQFKFVISKKKISVKRIVGDGEVSNETPIAPAKEPDGNKENIWSTVTKAVKSVFWGDHEGTSSTPHRYYYSNDTTSSSASKRKSDELSDSDISPLNHKRHKYEGRIRGRPPLPRCKTLGVESLRTSLSAESKSLLNNLSAGQDDALNQSF